MLKLADLFVATAYAQEMGYGEPLADSPIPQQYWKYVPLVILGIIVYFVFIKKKK